MIISPNPAIRDWAGYIENVQFVKIMGKIDNITKRC